MQNYSLIQKFLHDVVLKNKFINKSLFEIEKIIFLKNNEIENKPHIFISGLPRSGTTSILNFIYSSNEYASLTYRDIPFILSPNFSKLFNKKQKINKERIHKDGINYDLNSPEAFDEIFLNYDSKFVRNELINYLSLICLSKNKIKYLSKNNYNYNRIDLISDLLPNSNFLIPIREPLQHAYSLFKQHIHFRNLQKEDDFIRRYMNYLGHNEFGINHKPWNNPIHFKDSHNIDYWLEQWFLFYKNIFNKYNSYKNCHFIIYEKLTNPNYLIKLLQKLKLTEIKDLNLKFFKNSNRKSMNLDFSKNNYKNAINIYCKFKKDIF